MQPFGSAFEIPPWQGLSTVEMMMSMPLNNGTTSNEKGESSMEWGFVHQEIP